MRSEGAGGSELCEEGGCEEARYIVGEEGGCVRK